MLGTMQGSFIGAVPRLGWRKNNSRSAAVKLPRYRVQDIDTPEDWARAEMMWRVLREMGG